MTIDTFGRSAPNRRSRPTGPVAVIGATGTVGRLVLDEVLARQAEVRVLVRTARPAGTFASGVAQVVADLGDEAALRSALTGVRAVLFVLPHDPAEEQLARNLVRAAEATGTRIVFAGMHVSTRTLVGRLKLALYGFLLPHYRPKLRIGRLVAASRTNPVIFIPTNFYQNDEIFEADIQAGRFPTPLRGVNRVDVRDVAQLCAQALLDPMYPAGEYTVAGAASWSRPECARIWSQALHRPVTYTGDDEAVWRATFRHRLRGKKLTDFEATFAVLGRHRFTMSNATIAETTWLLGRAPRSYPDYVAERAAMLRSIVRVADSDGPTPSQDDRLTTRAGDRDA